MNGQRSAGEIQEAVISVLARDDDRRQDDLTAILIEVLVDIRDTMSKANDLAARRR